ncbi:DUF1722 domain-containing protein [Billgrantia gudaonensis]|uniref:DUF1722 domain-containing protein n=1 Tax=Billgrantia gudaonensis TaxID=376427 RepID=A0A432JHQ7_9GAMM|nr:DUF1722 domain-containing protein [Halomonas gudaonensis]
MRPAPPLPGAAEEARMNDRAARELHHRVYAFDDWKLPMSRLGPSHHAPLQFHSRQKYLLMAHHVEAFTVNWATTSRDAGKRPLDEAMSPFSETMAALSRPATRKTHANALMHVLGYPKQAFDSDTKQDSCWQPSMTTARDIAISPCSIRTDQSLHQSVTAPTTSAPDLSQSTPLTSWAKCNAI